jgi:RimJ/RimL family protein N-acetyltransferase
MTATACGDYPVDLELDLTLADGRRLRIRPLRRCEDDGIRAFYVRLSPRTRYLRFFSPMPSLPDAVLRLLTSVDDRRQLALVAEDSAANGEIVGLASFAAIDAQRGEVALVVRDDWQQRRVGITLADRVLRAAEDRGFRRFVVHVSTDNVAIRKLLTHVGDVVGARSAAGISEIEFVRRRSGDAA